MPINRRDIIQILRDENELLKTRNEQVSKSLARQQQAFRVLNSLYEKIPEYENTPDLPAVLTELLALVMHACNTENGSILLVDEEKDELEFVAVIGESQEHLMNHRISINTGVVGYSIQNGEAIVVDDVHRSNKWFSVIDERLVFNTHSLMCVPIRIDQRIIGAIEVVNHMNDKTFDENDLNVLKLATLLVSMALERIERTALSRENNA